jgi:hypothetical protein
VEDDQTGDESSYSVSPLVTQGRIALSDSGKAEALADNLEAQFQPVVDPSVPAVIEMVDGVLRSYYQTLASEPTLTNPDEVHEAIRGLKVGRAPGSNGLPNRALKHLPQGAVSLLVQIFNATLLTHHFPFMWKHAGRYLFLNRGRIRHCTHPITQLLSRIRLVKYLKRFF